MSLVSIIAILSLDVTRILVTVLGLGLGYDTDAAAAATDGVGRFTRTANPATSMPYPALAITGATNTTPIVITTAHPHGVLFRGVGGMSCLIRGVLGNTAANNVATDPKDRTVGLNQGVLAVPTGATTLALYGQDATGRLAAIAGNGTYTGGGTLTPALTDGSILIGRPATREHSAPPRIVLVPRTVASLPRRGSMPNFYAARNNERRSEIQERSIGTDMHAIDVHAWGQAYPPDEAGDFDSTIALRNAVRDALHLIACGSAETSGGAWDDQGERALQEIKAGHLFTFGITLQVPVLDDPMAGGLPFVPDGTFLRTTVQTTTPEVGATFDVTVTPR